MRILIRKIIIIILLNISGTIVIMIGKINIRIKRLTYSKNNDNCYKN